MAIANPPTIPAAPEPPDRNDRATFNQRARDWAAYQKDTLVPGVNDATYNVYHNAGEAVIAANAAGSYRTDAQQAAEAAEASAQAAEAIAATTFWESGHVYAAGDVVWSLAQPGKRYVRWVAGSGTTDPANDDANWKPLGAVGQITTEAITANTVATAGVHYVMLTPGITLTMPSGPLDGDQIGFTNASTGDVTVDWNGLTVKGTPPNPQAMTIPPRGSAQVLFSSSSTTWIEA